MSTSIHFDPIEISRHFPTSSYSFFFFFALFQTLISAPFRMSFRSFSIATIHYLISILFAQLLFFTLFHFRPLISISMKYCLHFDFDFTKNNTLEIAFLSCVCVFLHGVVSFFFLAKWLNFAKMINYNQNPVQLLFLFFLSNNDAFACFVKQNVDLDCEHNTDRKTNQSMTIPNIIFYVCLMFSISRSLSFFCFLVALLASFHASRCNFISLLVILRTLLLPPLLVAWRNIQVQAKDGGRWIRRNLIAFGLWLHVHLWPSPSSCLLFISPNSYTRTCLSFARFEQFAAIVLPLDVRFLFDSHSSLPNLTFLASSFPTWCLLPSLSPALSTVRCGCLWLCLSLSHSLLRLIRLRRPSKHFAVAFFSVTLFLGHRHADRRRSTGGRSWLVAHLVACS